MKKILVINGANLNMVGIREKAVYGEKTYRDLITFIKKSAKERGLKVKIFQSNHEGEIVDEIQRAYRRYDGIIINAGGYTHTSVVIADALKAVDIPTVEVHLTDIYAREDFRKRSFISSVAKKNDSRKRFPRLRRRVGLFRRKRLKIPFGDETFA